MAHTAMASAVEPTIDAASIPRCADSESVGAPNAARWRSR
jgi:hypothetical protein